MSSLYYQRKPVPEGFEEILHDLIKEILRNQPEEIEKFCYNYFDKQIRKSSSDTPSKTENAENIDPQMISLQNIQDRFILQKSEKGRHFLWSNKPRNPKHFRTPAVHADPDLRRPRQRDRDPDRGDGSPGEHI